MSAWLAALLAAAAIGLTYLFCVRPMTRDRAQQRTVPAENEEIAELRQELRTLRDQDRR